MVHKTSSPILSTELNTKSTTYQNHGIHKYKSTSSWLDEYDNEIDKMHRMLDKEYEESTRRQEESEAKIQQLQEEEEAERQMEEENLYREEMRQLEIEKAKAEVEAIKEQIKRLKTPIQKPIIPEVIEKKKPSLKSRIVSLGKKVTGIVGSAVGHPEVGAVTNILPEGNGKTTTKTVYKQPEYEDDYLVYGSWKKE
ncbi:MAG: hypothetical protein QXO70_04820 [Candidatus Pacearchaeota archaeon]